MNARKAQSAMEYLMTYGWAILIIAVVLGALFGLGVFSGSSLLGNACVASPGYLCQNLALNQLGSVSFTFGQNTGQQIFNIELACSATVSSNGMPTNSAAWAFIETNGQAINTINSLNLNGAIDLSPTDTVGVTGLQCYNQQGLPLSNLNIGTLYSDVILLNYTTTACTAIPCVAPTQWYTTKVASISTKVI